MRDDKKNLIVEMSTQFSLNIIEYCELLETKKKYALSNQLFRSGTSIGANIREAQNDESVKDFIHKFKLAAKEADETGYWLELCKRSDSYPTNDNLTVNLINMNRVISKIISSTKKKQFSN